MAMRPGDFGPAPGTSGGAPSGPAGGDLTGTYPDPTIGTGKVTSAKILDATIASGDIADNAIITQLIAAGAVTLAKLANLSAQGVLLGRKTAGAGVPEEISIGAGLTLPAGGALATAPGTVGGPPLIVRRTSISANKTNNTLANDDTLLWPITTTSIDFFKLWLIVNSANATMDFLSGWSVPAGATMSWAHISAGNTSINSFQGTTTATTPAAAGGAAGTIAVGSNATTFLLGIAGWVLSGGTAGNVNYQWAQNTTDAGVLTLGANSFLEITRLVA